MSSSAEAVFSRGTKGFAWAYGTAAKNAPDASWFRHNLNICGRH
jgi:hypothetical protein